MESLQPHSPSFLEESSQQGSPDHQDIHNSFDGLVEEIQTSSGSQPESRAQAIRAVQHCRSLEAIVSELLCEKQRLEEMNRQMQIALSRERKDYDRLLQRFVEQDVTLSCFQSAFPALQEGMRDLLGAWESIGAPGVYHTA
ncbi:hypothetical protein PMG11_05658 [Penicillium brasilianum]|uniref:Uncharacterized protein n=1 Tax=Penicillium brasilianum TaxID=104259 RepID=A0A0F7TPT0_PENBI|nr:hypothetical protein PMG11_05658 [Penicillium brasilianum]